MNKLILALALGIPFQALAATEVAQVNQSVITLEEINEKLAESQKYFQSKTPTRKAVLEDLIKRELVVQEARKIGLEKEPDVAARINGVLFQALIEKKLTKEFDSIKVSDSEAKAFYAKSPEIRTSHIFVSVKPGASAQEVQKAKDKITKIRDSYLKDGKMSFVEVAQRYSEGVAAPMGGDIDFQTKDKLDPVYYETALKLQPSKMSDIIRTQFGFHIVKLTSVRKWEDTDKTQAKRMVFEEKRELIFDRFVNSLKSQAKVAIKAELVTE